MREIISKIDTRLIEKVKEGQVTIMTVVSLVIEVWTSEITLILKKRA